MSSTTSPKGQIGFVGLGAMGFGMATHLLKQGYPVKGFDVWPPTMQKWKDAGGIVAKSLTDSATGSSFYVVMVASMGQVESALFGKEDGIVKALPQGATLLVCSTVPASFIQSVSDSIKKSRPDILLIDAPVSGGALRAAAGTLSIMAGASEEALKSGKWLLSELSEKLYIVPTGIGGGSNLKMAHQVLAGIQILATSEALGLAARLGLNATETVSKVIASDGWSWMFENRSVRTLKEDYYPGASAVTIILKDVGIITQTSRQSFSPSFPLPLTSVSEQVYVTSLSLGYGPNDDAGIVRLYHPSGPISTVTEPTKPTSPGTVTNLFKISSGGDSSQPASYDTVINLLKAVHIVSAAEAITFAHALDLDLNQFADLVNDAAGGSAMFKKYFNAMHRRIVGDTKSSDENGLISLEELNGVLENVLWEARKVECPVWLTTEAQTVVAGVLRRSLKKGVKGGLAADVVQYWL